MTDSARSRFNELLTRLARVPKREIDEQERKHEKRREKVKAARNPAKPGHIVPPVEPAR